jgi:hypothetical protein
VDTQSVIASEKTNRIIRAGRPCPWIPEAGTPQGSGISPLLSNIYLDELDHKMEQLGYKMVRYADDIVVLRQSQEEAEKAEPNRFSLPLSDFVLLAIVA